MSRPARPHGRMAIVLTGSDAVITPTTPGSSDRPNAETIGAATLPQRSRY